MVSLWVRIRQDAQGDRVDAPQHYRVCVGIYSVWRNTFMTVRVYGCRSTKQGTVYINYA